MAYETTSSIQDVRTSFQRRPGRPTRFEKASDPRKAMIRLFGYLKPFKKPLASVVCFVLLQSLLGLAGPYLLGRAIDTSIGGKDVRSLLNTAALMLIAYVLSNGFNILANWRMARISQNALKNLRGDLFVHIQSLPMSFFDTNPAGGLMSRLTNDIDAINQTVSQNIIALLASIITILGILVSMFVLNHWLALASLVVIPIMYWFSNFVAKYTRKGFRELQKDLGNLNAGAERVFEIIDMESETAGRDETNSRHKTRADGQAAEAGAPRPRVPFHLDGFQGNVTLQNVVFGYRPDNIVIRDFSVEIKAGQTVALVGPTGAGKTTITNLLTRFYEIQSGRILFDGVDIREIPKKDIRRAIGLVLQDTFLFADTVLENIRFGRLDATDEACIKAAKMAEADHFIRQLPDGYHTNLSERAGNLSQGQRQLLSIARAILADPRILILDEATSSVDTRTELRIQKALLRLMEGRTSIVIAHRLSTIRDADSIVVINDGEIVEQGNHEALLGQRGFYYHLYMSQFKGNEI
ncbi:MAG: hypothetical protein SAMD01599839_16250 [Rectinema sp.]